MTSIPDIYRYEAQRIDTLLFNDVYDNLVRSGGIAVGSEQYHQKNSPYYFRTTGPILFQDLKVHLRSEPLIRGGFFRLSRGMIVEMNVIGWNIESKLENVIEKFNFKLKEKNPF